MVVIKINSNFVIYLWVTGMKKLNRFSRWNDVVRAIARLQRRAKGIKDASLSTVQERQEAANFLIKLVQEVELLETSKLEQLCPVKEC